MDKYDDLFADTTADASVFADKSALDPLAEPAEVAARQLQERALARILGGLHEGYLPPTVTIYGPPGTGKTLTVRRVCREFAARNDDVAVVYVNLKESRTIFSAANEILYELTGEQARAYQGLDGVFEAIWTALEDYPAWTVLLLDEIDHVRHDSNYEPSEFFYRLLRGEGKLKRRLHLSAFLISNELLAVDLRLDSRVRSAMSDDEVFFPPYDVPSLARVVLPRLEQAFEADALPAETRWYGINRAATQWGDARKALTLFRRAGETANEWALDAVTTDCIDENLEGTQKEAIKRKLLTLPGQHFFVLRAITGVTKRSSGEIIQPVATAKVRRAYDSMVSEGDRLGDRALRGVIADLQTMGLVETWVTAREGPGRTKLVETTFDPAWVKEVFGLYVGVHEEVSDESELEE